MKLVERERKKFEQWISSHPFEWSIERFSTDELKTAWPGQYRNISVQLAWKAWLEAKELEE